MISEIESTMGISIAQLGLLLDIVGFVVIFIFGGFQFGVRVYVSDEYGRHVLPARIMGSLTAVAGFALQFIGGWQ